MPIDVKLNSEYNFLFNSFSSSEIDAIIFDLNLFREQYELLYVVDTYDIVENYLPYTEIELFSNRKRNQEAQKYICYDYFFGDMNRTSTILLNEYKVELLAAKNKLTKHLKEAKYVLNNLDTLKRDTNDFVSNSEKTEEFFKNHFEVLLLLLILNDKSHTIFEEFFGFLKTRLSVSEVRTKNIEDSDLLGSIFDSCKFGKLAIQVFEQYIEENKSQLLAISSHTDRHIYLENTFRDSQVIDRIIQINKLIQDKKLKYHVIYLSTAYKTKELFKAIKRINNISEIDDNFSHLQFHRTIYQYFLFDKIKNEFGNDLDKGIEILRSIQSLINKTSDNSYLAETLQSINDDGFSKIIKSLSTEKSNMIDNHFYLSVYERYKATFDVVDNSEKKKTLNKTEIVSIIKEIDREKSKYDASLFTLDFTLSQLNQTYEVIDTFYNISEYELEYKYGNDIIHNPYQHLPYLLLINEYFDSALKTKLYAFLNSAIEVNPKNKEMLKHNLRALMNELTKLNLDDGYNRLLRSLILTYTNFVAQPKEKKADFRSSQNNKRYNESEFILDLEKQYDIIKYQFAKIDTSKTKIGEKVQFKIGDSILVNEINYVLIWLYRRTGKDEELGIEKGMELIKNGVYDPRIYQGIGLCHISIMYKLIKKNQEVFGEEVKKHLDIALHFLRLAQEKFKILINTNDKTDTTYLVLKNYIAVLNSIADISLRKYEFEFSRHKDISLLEIARSMINEIKEIFDILSLLYDDYPTYSATEMEIEYYEAEHLYNSGAKSKAHQKIINALNRATILRKILPEKSYVDKMFVDKVSLINKLNSKILSEF